MNKVFGIASLFLIFLLFPITTAAQSAPQAPVLSEEINYTFGEQLEVQLSLQEGTGVSEVDVILQSPRTPSFAGAMSRTGDGNWYFGYDLKARPFPAFAPISYSFRMVRESGEEITTEKRTFTYFDNRFNWQQLQDDPFVIYWYEGDIPFAQQVLDAAQTGKTDLLELLQQPEITQPINIFIYNSEDELQQTIQSTNQSWVGGHAAPELSAVVVSLPPGVEQSLEIQRQIPHEISHILMYRFMGAEFQYLPVWVSEGIASQMEFYSRPEYAIILEKAAEERRLIPLSQLCQVFPADPALIPLAYAEADSVMRYIRQEYGTAGIQALIAAYDQGVSCDRGVEIALGRSLTRLEWEWKQAALFRSRNLIIMAGLTFTLVILLSVIIGMVIRKSRRSKR